MCGLLFICSVSCEPSIFIYEAVTKVFSVDLVIEEPIGMQSVLPKAGAALKRQRSTGTRCGLPIKRRAKNDTEGFYL